MRRLRRHGFNSLQTGKSFWRFMPRGDDARLLIVSIPFKRESPFGVIRLKSFVTSGNTVFQFPSNGKVLLEYSDRIRELAKQIVSIPFKRESPFGVTQSNPKITWIYVSIPFKRESPFGGEPIPANELEGCICFNSLQTGKSFWRRLLRLWNRK